MVPGHPSHSALGAFHPTPIASSRTSDQPTALRRRRRRAGIRRRVRCRSRRRKKTTPEHSTPPSERGTTTSTRTPTETSRDRGNSHATACFAVTPPPLQRCGNNKTEDDEAGPRAQHTTAGVQGNYVNPHTDDDEPRPRDAHADPCPAATAPPLPPPRRPRRAAREAGFPVGSARPLRRRAAAKMSPRIRTGPETVPTAHALSPSAAAATAGRKADQVPIPEQNFSRRSATKAQAPLLRPVTMMLALRAAATAMSRAQMEVPFGAVLPPVSPVSRRRL